MKINVRVYLYELTNGFNNLSFGYEVDLTIDDKEIFKDIINYDLNETLKKINFTEEHKDLINEKVWESVHKTINKVDIDDRYEFTIK